MLTEGEIELLRDNAYCYDHEWRPYAILCGEPFLIKSSLCFFDGFILTVIGRPLDRRKFDLECLRQLIASNSHFNTARYIMYLTEVEIPADEILDGFIHDIYVPKDPWSCDYAIHLPTFSLDDKRDIRRELRLAHRDKVVVERSNKKIFAREHIRLIEEFHETHWVDLFSSALYGKFQACVLMDDMIFYEAWRGSELCGVFLVSRFTPTRHVGLLGFPCKSVKSAGAMIYHEVVMDARNFGAEYLHLGPSTGVEGLSRFKLKWGAQAVTPPCMYYLFRSNESPAMMYDDYIYSWSDRLLQRELLKKKAIRASST